MYIQVLPIRRNSVAAPKRKKHIVLLLYWEVQKVLCEGEVGDVPVFLNYTLIYSKGHKTRCPLLQLIQIGTNDTVQTLTECI